VATAPRRKTGAVRRKKATRRRTTSTGRSKSGKLPNWSLLVLGLAIGLLSAWLIQLIIHGMRNPDSGLNNLMKQSKPAVDKPAVKDSGNARSQPRPTYDFYTILPETETQLTDRDWDRQKRVPIEQGVNYMLQAASYSSYRDADRLKARLILNGLSPSIEKVTIEDKGTFYRVRVGPYTNTAEVDSAREVLAGLGIKPMLLKIARSGSGKSR
jgi:hypothetical protein